MGFLDNSGDIILDAVLTDTGRKRLAAGNGSFKVDKFALGDDEIDYGLYDKNNASGSAYYDVTILQTPVLEAFTNNTSLLKSRLMTIGRDNVLYLPVMKLYTTSDGSSGTSKHSSGPFIVPVDKTTIDNLGTLGTGILNGYEPNNNASHIRIDQGLDSTFQSPEDDLAEDLIERAYIVEMDNRLGSIFAPPSAPSSQNVAAGGNANITAATPSFVDDDNIASYRFTFGPRSGFVTGIGGTKAASIVGPRGTKTQFRSGGSLNVRTTSYLFDQIGNTGGLLTNSITGGNNLAAGTYKYIDSTVRVTGMNTGYRVDVPVRFIKSI